MALFGGIERLRGVATTLAHVVGPGPIGIDVDPHRGTSSDIPKRRRGWALALLTAWLAQVAVRLWFAAEQSLPTALPDEIGYLSGARLLAGHGISPDLSSNTLYRGGYGLLMSPAFLLAHNPVRAYHLVQVENALIGAFLLPLAYVLARRLGTSRAAAFVLANAAALLPCAVFFGAFALTDAILPVLMLGWLLLSHSWLTLPIASRADRVKVAASGAGAAALAAFVDVVHSRGAVLLLVHTLLILLAAVRKWCSRPVVALSAGALIAVFAAGEALNAFVQHRLYTAGVRDLGGTLRERVTSTHGWGWTLRIATGEVWYQVVVTGGLAGIGLMVVIAMAFRRGTAPPVRALAVALVAVVIGIATGTAAALPDEHRIGNDAYGRYLACLTPPLFVLGAVTLLRARRRTATAACAGGALPMLAGAAVVSVFAGSALTHDTLVRFDFPDLSALTWNWTGVHVWPTTAAGLVLLAAAVAASRVRGQAAPVLLACLFGAVGIITLAGDRVHVLPEPIPVPLAAMKTLSDAPNGPTWNRAGRGVAIDSTIPWQISELMQYRTGWDQAIEFAPRPPLNATLVILNWDGHTPVDATWPAGAAAHFHVTSERWVEGSGGWVAWALPKLPPRHATPPA
jgi:hypothetical protein